MLVLGYYWYFANNTGWIVIITTPIPSPRITLTSLDCAPLPLSQVSLYCKPTLDRACTTLECTNIVILTLNPVCSNTINVYGYEHLQMILYGLTWPAGKVLKKAFVQEQWVENSSPLWIPSCASVLPVVIFSLLKMYFKSNFLRVYFTCLENLSSHNR